MNYEYFLAEVIAVIDETEYIKRFFLKAPENIHFTFNAGQFVMLDLPIPSNQTNRSFSIASAPGLNNEFEICIVRKEDGMGTGWIWENLKKGTQVPCTTALGKFTLPEVIETDLCFIATGTGIAPVRSMVLDIYQKSIPHRNIVVISGNRRIHDILYRSDFEVLEKQHPEFKFIPVLSRETPETWSGKIGYIHPVYQELFPSPGNVTFFICGWNLIVKEVRDNLKKLGYGRSEMRYELYD